MRCDSLWCVLCLFALIALSSMGLMSWLISLRNLWLKVRELPLHFPKPLIHSSYGTAGVRVDSHCQLSSSFALLGLPHFYPTDLQRVRGKKAPCPRQSTLSHMPCVLQCVCCHVMWFDVRRYRCLRSQAQPKWPAITIVFPTASLLR